MAQTVAGIEARLARVRAAIDQVLDGGVSEFAHEGGDSATMLSLGELQRLEQHLLSQLAAAKRRGGNRFQRIRWPLSCLLWGLLLMQQSIVCGAGIETAILQPPAATAPVFRKTGATNRSPRATHGPYHGGSTTRLLADFQPPHRSGDASTRLGWDLLTRRMRNLVDNNPLMSRMINLLAQFVVGEGINAYSAAIDHLPMTETQGILTHPLFLFGDESDEWYDRWANEWADVSRQSTLYELQHTSAIELFGAGNTLWLECRKRTTDGAAPICYQVLEAEQLDRSKDRPATDKQNRISNGIEYDLTNEPVAYWLFDAHPYDDLAGMGLGHKSSRVPASRVTHCYLSTRASQHFGVSLGNAALQSTRDADWLVGHELTSAAIAAGLTLLIKESDAGADVDMDGDDPSLAPPCDRYDLDHVSEVGLAAGSAARVGKDESVDIVESKRPNRDVAPFVHFISNLVSMSGNVSLHRFTGNPTGASFATLRAMMNDDRAMALRLTTAVGRKVAGRPRIAFDRQMVALGRYKSVSAADYLRRPHVYQDLDVLGPPFRSMTPLEDIKAARMRIASGLSTLRAECGLLNLCYRRVLRQLAVERDLTRALSLVLDFSSGGGAAPDHTTTDGGTAA